MAVYESLVVTNAGKQLLEKVYLNSVLEFTKIVTFENINYTSAVQEFNVNSFEFGEENKLLNVTSSITNRDLEKGYYLNCVGLYAIDPDDGEILLAYINASEADYMTAFNEKVGETILEVTFCIKISSTDNFQIIIPERTYALAYDLKNKVVLIDSGTQEVTPINLGFVIDDKLSVSDFSGELKVSPNMGLKIED